MPETLHKIASELTQILWDTGDRVYVNEEYIIINKINIVRALFFLKKARGYLQLVDLFGVSGSITNSQEQTFDGFFLHYHVLNHVSNTRIILKTFLEKDEIISSICQVFLNANFYEREAFEMLGIKFLNHPNLKNLFK